MQDESKVTSLGVSAGTGMIHYVLLTRDDVGRHVVDSRVIDVDESDGHDAAGRVNSGIDLMLTAARESGLRAGPIGIAARTGAQRRELRSRGAGPRRQIHLVGEDESVVEYLSVTGQINRFDTVVVVDCGDSGMSIYTVHPADGTISWHQRSLALSGRALDRAIVDELIGTGSGAQSSTGIGARSRRRALLSACRTAKEELSASGASTDTGSILVADGVGELPLTSGTVETAVAPMVGEARKVLARYLADADDRGTVTEAVVLVGGLANLPAVRSMLDSGSDVEMIVPPNPELAAPSGAAVLARNRTTAATSSQLAFIGGHRHREWLSATPIAVVGALLAATLMTIYAVSSSLAGNNSPAPAPASTPTSYIDETGTTTTSEPQTTSPRGAPPAPPAAPIEPQPATPAPDPGGHWDGSEPGWETTKLVPTPPPTASAPPTRTLEPFPLPSLPWPEGSTPTIPPGLLPPGIDPDAIDPNLRPTPAPGVNPDTGQRAPQRQQAPTSGQGTDNGGAPETAEQAPAVPNADEPATTTP